MDASENNSTPNEIRYRPENDPLTPTEFFSLWSRFLNPETTIPPNAEDIVTVFQEWWNEHGAADEEERNMTTQIADFAREQIHKKTDPNQTLAILFSVSEEPIARNNSHLKLAASLLENLMTSGQLSIDQIYNNLHPSYRGQYSQLMNHHSKKIFSSPTAPQLEGIPIPVREAFRLSAWDPVTGKPKDVKSLAVEWANVLGEEGEKGARRLRQIAQESQAS